ncbi:sugar kinase, partial [uncultured Sulfitobacter sp.]|uniref:sugar kinase n=1 Tax=uncultured Sulfitobacter sp. TaxID=191468 RepID=UPI00260EE417
MKRIACIGEAMIELSMTDDAAQVGVAGDTLNTAIYLHRTAPSLTVDYVTCLGDDPFSARINDFIAREGVGTSAVRTVPGASPGLYAITTRPDGERSFTYWRNTSAARQLFDDGDFSVLSSYDAVYLTGISLAILPHAVRKSLLAWLEASSITVIYDSNYRPRLWDSEAHAREITTAFWQRADIALPSLDDEMALFGETADEVIARFNRLSVTGALKRGAAGPISLGIPVKQTYQRANTVVDTTGAGDSFNGGYLGCYFLGLEHFACL